MNESKPEIVVGKTVIEKKLNLITFAEVEAQLKLIENASKIILSPGGWTLPQILEHCAQSIEGSLNGFPKNKSKLFQHTIGKIAFSMFDRSNAMNHGLTEAIPGADFSPGLQLTQALSRLHRAIDQFKNFNGKLYPHFAYGNLSKAQHEKAHSMHISNHLSSLEIIEHDQKFS